MTESLPTPDPDGHAALVPSHLPTYVDLKHISRPTGAYVPAAPTTRYLQVHPAVVPARNNVPPAARIPPTAPMAPMASLATYQPFGPALGLSLPQAYAPYPFQPAPNRIPHPLQPAQYLPMQAPHPYTFPRRLSTEALPTPASTADLALTPITPIDSPTESAQTTDLSGVEQRQSKSKPATSAVALTPPDTTANSPTDVPYIKPVITTSRPRPARKPKPTLRLPATNNRLEPEDQLPKAIVDRFFARYAKTVGGVELDPATGKKFWHFDDATRLQHPGWPSHLYAGLVHFYAEHARPRRTREGDLVALPSVVRFATNVRRFYARNKGRSLPPVVTQRVPYARQLQLKHGPKAEAEILDMAGMRALARAVWSPQYTVSFRERVDIALYMALILATGMPSHAVLPPALPSDGDMVYLTMQKKDGLRWGDFRLFTTPNGPMASLRRRSGTERVFCLNPGPVLGLSVAELAMVAMYLDGVISHEDHSLDYFLSPSFWGSTPNQWRMVEFDVANGNTVWRNQRTNAPLVRSDINRELRRLGEIAGLEHEVTSGAIRRFVTDSVYAKNGFEACNAVLDHKSPAFTRKYLNKKGRRNILKEETDVGYRMEREQAQRWRNLAASQRRRSFHLNTNILVPLVWGHESYSAPKPSPVTPSPAARAEKHDELLARVGEWMAAPYFGFRQQVHLVPQLRKWQYFERVPQTKPEFNDALMKQHARAHQPPLDETWDEESLDSDDE